MIKSDDDRNTLTLTNEQVAAFRLQRHHLNQRVPNSSLVDVVRDVCGIQAQLMSGAQFALWARIRGLTPTDMERALWKERTIVKTWCMRRTVHLLSSEELPIYIGALKRSGVREEQRWITGFGVNQEDVTATIDAIVQALASGPLTRQQLTERVVILIGSKAKRWVQHSWGGVVKQACLQGLVCFGPNQGREITFVRRGSWLSNQRDMPTEEAENYLLSRYLHSYGPASASDFAVWTGMARAEILPIRERLEGEIVDVIVNGKTAMILSRDLKKLRAGTIDSHVIRLLPSFDPFMLGHRDKGFLVGKAHYKHVYRKAGWLSPVVILNGQVVGIWTHKPKAKGLQITVTLFRPLASLVLDMIQAEANDLARFLGLSGEVTIYQRKNEGANSS